MNADSITNLNLTGGDKRLVSLFQEAQLTGQPLDDLMALLFAARSNATPTHTHTKTQGTYAYQGEVKVQTAEPINDKDMLVLYQGKDGKRYVRPVKEFEERFTLGVK